MVHPYFCPRCGEGYEAKACRGNRRLGFHYLRCPECGCPVVVSGSTIIVIGLILALFCGMLLCCDAETEALGILLGFGAFGLFREFEKYRAKKRRKAV